MAYNILLFGETGAGKSTTTINALANYLWHASFDEAASAGELVNLVPSKFTYPETNESKIVDQNVLDPDTNKSHDNSAGTPKHYELELGSDDNNKKQIRIIDTLGIGNLEIDKENFKIILEHLKGLETLHRICFLIDKNSVFKSNLNELLSQVPRSASKNILFCFNFSQSQHLDGAGSQFEVLKTLLDENELGCSKIDLEIGENCFFIDNEAFQFLLTTKLSDNSALTEDQTVHYRENWNASRDQTISMLQHIVSNNFEPIQLELLFKLINTQKWIQKLALPIDELKAKIHDQKETIKEDQRKMNSFNNKSKKRSSNAKQIKTTNDRIKAKRQVLREFEMELELIEKFLCTCLRFVVLNANFNCKDLILPYAELLAKDKSLDHTEQNQLQNQQPLVRRNSSRGSKRGKKRTNSTPKSPPNEPNNNKITSSNQVKVDDIKLLQTKLTQLKHSGKQLRDIFNVGLQITKNSNVSQNQKSEQLNNQSENENNSPISTEKKEEIQNKLQNSKTKEESKTADELQISNSDTPKLNDVENSEAKVELEQQNLFEQINELTLKNEQIEKSFEAALEMLESHQSELLQQNSSIHVENEVVEDEVVKEVVTEEVVKEEVNEVLKEEMNQEIEENPQLNPIPVIQSPKLEQFLSIEEDINQLPLNQNQELKQGPNSDSITSEIIPEPVPVNPKQELNKNPQQFNNYSTFDSKPSINEAPATNASSSNQIKSSFNDVLESVQSNLTEKVDSKDDSKDSISNGITEKSDDSVLNPKETKSQTEELEISESKIPEPTDNPELTSTSETTQTKDQEIKASPQESVAKSTPSSNAPLTTKNGKTKGSNSRKQSSTKQKQSKSKNSKPKKSKGRSQSTERSSSGCDCPCSIM